jgi:HD superfamily phosphodiesterase
MSDLIAYINTELKRQGRTNTIHDFGHQLRVAKGAVWFVKILEGSERQQKLAYIAGLLHDIVRPATEKICHAAASAKKSERILKNFGWPEKDIQKIVRAIADHRERPKKWLSPLHQSVYLADKILEQMGAYVAFRRCQYVGECEDFRKWPWLEAVQKHFQDRLEKFPPKEFPKRFQTLVSYQYDWPFKFAQALRTKQTWAVYLGKYAWSNGLDHRMSVEQMIENFKPRFKEDVKFKKEALAYIKGRKFRHFGNLLKI